MLAADSTFTLDEMYAMKHIHFTDEDGVVEAFTVSGFKWYSSTHYVIHTASGQMLNFEDGVLTNPPEGRRLSNSFTIGVHLGIVSFSYTHNG